MKFLYRLKQLTLCGGDIISFALGFWISLSIRYWHTPNWQQIEQHLVLFFFLFLLWVVVNFINGLYDLGKPKVTQAWRRLVESAAIAFALSIIFIYIFPKSGIAPKTILILNIVIGYGLSAIWRLIYDKYIGLHSLQQNVILVGLTPESEELIHIIENNPHGVYKIVALLEPREDIKPKDFPFCDVYKSLNVIRPAITNHKADLIVIAPHIQRDQAFQRELYELLFWPVRVTDLTTFYEVITGRIPPSTFSETWFLDNLKNNEHPIYQKFRLIIDWVAGILGGLLFLILFPFIFVATKLSSHGPVLYKQQRVGQGGTIFYLYKFRSMFALTPDGSAELQGPQFTTKDDTRVTKIGKFLRLSRLDELPQFINLLKGDITLIGPRPERPEIVKQLEANMVFYSLRHIIKPGLTGWAVVQQNYTDTLEKTMQKLQYDLYYIKNQSIFLDISILLRTINLVIRMMGQ